ncbi:unnamed protein product, partial [Porites lobata]
MKAWKGRLIFGALLLLEVISSARVPTLPTASATVKRVTGGGKALSKTAFWKKIDYILNNYVKCSSNEDCPKFKDKPLECHNDTVRPACWCKGSRLSLYLQRDGGTCLDLTSPCKLRRRAIKHLIHVCDENAICQDTGQRYFTCTCKRGFVGNGIRCKRSAKPETTPSMIKKLKTTTKKSQPVTPINIDLTGKIINSVSKK